MFVLANLKSAIKRVEVNNKKRERNQSLKTNMRTEMKKVEHFIEENDVENAKKAYQKALRTIDKVVQKGAIHKNNGNRQKARLRRKLNQLER